MGIDASGLQFLALARATGVSFAQIMTIGRQNLLLTSAELTRGFEAVGCKLPKMDPSSILTSGDGFAEPLLRAMGADVIESMDVSAYEGASTIQDLNFPIPDTLAKKFTTVLDGGSLEHIFNFPTAMANCMAMVAVGGHFIGISPANNNMGHGFYQFSPELYFRVFESNGFRLERLMVRQQRRHARWYAAKDPREVQTMLQLTNCQSLYLYVQARKIADVPIFAQAPQQAFYDSFLWKRDTVGGNLRGNFAESNVRRVVAAVVPQAVKVFRADIRRRRRRFDKRAFRKVNIRELAAQAPGSEHAPSPSMKVNPGGRPNPPT